MNEYPYRMRGVAKDVLFDPFLHKYATQTRLVMREYQVGRRRRSRAEREAELRALQGLPLLRVWPGQ